MQDIGTKLGAAFDIGLYVGQVRCRRMIVGLRCEARDSLMVEGSADSAADRDSAEAMFRTIEFAD